MKRTIILHYVNAKRSPTLNILLREVTVLVNHGVKGRVGGSFQVDDTNFFAYDKPFFFPIISCFLFIHFFFLFYRQVIKDVYKEHLQGYM